MFSSTYDSSPFPNFPSSSYPTLPFYIDPDNDFGSNTSLLHDPSLVVAPFIPNTAHDAASLIPEETLANLAAADCTAAILDHDYAALYSGVPNWVTQKPVAAIAKKNRHSKIHTSQGLRDRRVRLSSEIARKFFDLQDMLEFDKPSNTLEWLFTKSENAIKELVRSKHTCSSISSGDKCSCDPCEPQGVVHSSEKSMVVGGADSSSKGRKLKWTQREDVCVMTKKESRDKARARARERTCNKMNNNNGRVHDLEERLCPAASNAHQVLHQLRSSPQPELEACVRWPHMAQPYPHHILVGEAHNGDGFSNNVIDESSMIKRNMKPSDHPDQNLVIPKGASFNNINDYYSSPFPYSTPNWDVNDTIYGCSNLHGIATMNISTCFMNQWCGSSCVAIQKTVEKCYWCNHNYGCIVVAESITTTIQRP